MATKGTRILFLVLEIVLLCSSVLSFRPGSRAKTLHFPHKEDDDGIKRIRRSIPTENAGHSARSRTARQAENDPMNTPDESPPGAGTGGQGIQVSKVDLNDPHPELIVHWAGENSDVILCLTRSISQTTHSASYVYISSNYGVSFANKSSAMFASSSGSRPVYDRFYSSKADYQRYMFTDVVNSLVTTTLDSGSSFSTFSIPFKPSSIFTHPSNPTIVLGMDENDESKRLYISDNFGATWKLVDQDVKSFNWGVEPWDRTDTIYIEREEVGGTSSVYKSDDFFDSNGQLVISGIKDFEVRDDYLFATQEKSGTEDELDLLVSHDRGPFRTAEFPFDIPNRDFYITDASDEQVLICVFQPKDQTRLYISETDFYIADASEEQVFACVYHQNAQTHLYISEAKGVEFAISLMNISYYNPEGVGKDTWLKRYADEPFADFHKVDGLRGIYAATQLSNTDGTGSFEAANMKTVGTFDKGGEWFPIPAPIYDADGNLYNCNLEDGCSLHISQKFSQLAPGSRTVPVLSKKSAPGLILGTGKVGTTLLGNETADFNVYLSASAGATWYEVLRGNHFFAFGDHGGVVTAVEQRGDTNAVKYSVNEGETWHSEAFSDSKIYVYGLMTEPGEKTLTFTVFGSETATHSWLIVQINFRNVFSTVCGDDDYKQWWPGEEFPEHSCLLGRKTIYERRRVHSDCFNGRDYDRPISSVNCTCDRDDFECDFGFMESFEYMQPCVKDPEDDHDPTVQPDPCPEGTYWRRSKGYRKVEGDTCKGGDEKYYEADQVSCPVAENPEFILYAERTEIRRYFLADGTDERLPIENLELATAVDYDVDHDCYYYSEVTVDEIHRFCPSQMDDQDQVIVGHDLDMVEGLAFDWLADNLYWVDSTMDVIEVARFDGRFRRHLTLSFPNGSESVVLDQPRALALDPKRGFMFWSDWGNNPYIASAHMDGKNVTMIITTGVYWPNGLAIDDASSHIFWTDAHFDRIETAWLDGSHRQVLLSDNVPHPFAIAVYNNLIYWDDWSQLAIKSANKYNGVGVRTVVSNLDSAMDLKIFHNASQQGENPCSVNNGGCTHLCIVKPDASNPDMVTRVCLCTDSDPDITIVITPDGREECQCAQGEKMDVTTGTCITQGSTCEQDQFQCSGSDQCIPNRWRCDHEADCPDGSDEYDCVYYTCSPDEFRCETHAHNCIPLSWQCDHYDDCGDNSDERDCVFPSCSHDQFTCMNGRCIPMSYVCDEDNDCWDNSDELRENCNFTDIPTTMPMSCSPNYTQCEPNGRCIPSTWICDGEDDCGNGWDEQNCEARSCYSYQFTCDNGNCIPSYWKCDNYDDCGDNSDERDCPTTTYAPWTTDNPFNCNPGDFHCLTSDLCLPYTWKCDGYRDCEDGSDEYDCGTNETSTIYPFTCEWDSFVCNNGQCIPGDWECDFYNDCSDGSDEDHCFGTTEMPTTTASDCGFLRVPCVSGSPRCIFWFFVCDGEAQCSDGSDEAHCGSPVPSTTRPVPTTVSSCPTSQFKCRNGQKCIPRSEKCNGYYDCSDNSDEEDCHIATTPFAEVCGSNQFYCSYTDSCLDGLKHCNSDEDCLFGQDEYGCNHTYVVSAMYVEQALTTRSAVARFLVPAIPHQFTIINYKREADPLADHRGHDIPNPISERLDHPPITKATAFEHMWDNLKEETEYVFTTSIEISSVEFDKVPLVSYTTPREATSVPTPTNVHAIQMSDQGRKLVNVTWDYPTGIPGPIIFDVYYRQQFSATYSSAGVTRARYLNVYQYPDEQQLYFSVIATVGTVQGNRSQEAGVFVGKGTIQHAPTNITSSGVRNDRVSLVWAAPADEEPDVKIDGYMVYATWNGVERQNLVNSTTTSATVSNLCPGFQYSFEVAAFNKYGRGQYSAARQIATAGTAYSPPQNLTAVTLSKTSVQLNWLAPVTAPPKPLYEIAYGLSTPTVYGKPISDLTYVVNGLSADERYIFLVRLHVDAKCQTPEAEKEALTQYEPTLPPRALTTADIDFQRITVQWNSPRDYMPAAIGYIVYYWNASEPDTKWNVTVEPTRDQTISKDIPNLVPGGNYSFQVTASAEGARGSNIYTERTTIPSEPMGFQVDADNDGVIRMYWKEPKSTWNMSLGFAVYLVRSEVPFPGQKDISLIPPEAKRKAEQNTSLWTITGGIQDFHYEIRDLDPELYAVMVSVDQYKGYYGKTTTLQFGNIKKVAGPSKQISKNQALYAGIAVSIVVIVLIVIVVYFAIRHRRLQQSFMSFANSHYDTRSGTATFATSDDDDGGDLGSDEDQPMIRGFSDDVPLVIA